MDIVTVKQAATQLEISVQGIHAALRRGAITAEKVGRDWLISRKEISRYNLQRKAGLRRKGTAR